MLSIFRSSIPTHGRRGTRCRKRRDRYDFRQYAFTCLPSFVVYPLTYVCPAGQRVEPFLLTVGDACAVVITEANIRTETRDKRKRRIPTSFLSTYGTRIHLLLMHI